MRVGVAVAQALAHVRARLGRPRRSRSGTPARAPARRRASAGMRGCPRGCERAMSASGGRPAPAPRTCSSSSSLAASYAARKQSSLSRSARRRSSSRRPRRARCRRSSRRRSPCRRPLARPPRAGASAATRRRATGRGHGCREAAGEGCRVWLPRCVRPGTLPAMDLTLSPSEQAFRDELRSWLADNHPGDDPPGRRRSLRAPAPVAAPALRRRLRRLLVAEGVRRPRRDARRAGALRRGDGARPGAPAGQRARHGDGRTRRDPPRHRRAEGALAQPDPHRRRDLVPGLL